MKNKNLRIITISVATTIVIYLLLGIECPFKRFFGIPCAGCGMTRAIKSALKFDFTSAFYYHPLFPTVPIILFVLIFADKFKPKFHIIFWALTAIIYLLVYLIRITEDII